MFFNSENNNFGLLREEHFGYFLTTQSWNTLHLKANPLKCGLQQKPIFDWILRQNHIKDRVFGAECSDGTSIWDFDWTSDGTSDETSKPILFCNENGEYDGQYGIKKWPKVRSGQYSVVNCPKGDGEMRWLCKEDGVFHENGPEMDECWLDDLLDKNYTSVEEVEKTLEVIIENTGNSSSLNSMESLQKVVEIVSKLENFLKNKTIESSMRMARKWMNVG